MNIFSLGTYDHDGATSQLFLHENRTPDEFREDVKFILRSYGSEYLRSLHIIEDGQPYTLKATTDGWVYFAIDKLSELGYTHVVPTSVSFFDCTISKRYTSYLTMWKEYIGDILYESASEHNADLEISY